MLARISSAVLIHTKGLGFSLWYGPTRLAWVDANYIRADTVTTANNRLVDYQTTIRSLRPDFPKGRRPGQCPAMSLGRRATD
jgi:hypothetical protein